MTQPGLEPIANKLAPDGSIGSRREMRGRNVSSVAVLCLSAALLAVCLFQIWANLDYIRMDHTGHLASGISFSRVGFHEFNDSFFLGSIQNLFYPPLEDALLALLHSVLDPITAYKVLLSLFVILYVGAATAFSITLRSPGARLVWIAGFLMLLFADKSEQLTYLQGLSLFDLYITGLTSQILSAALLIFLIVAVRSGRPVWSAILLALCVLSHIITALVAFVFCAAWILLSRDLRFLVPAAIGIGMTAFFWVPFLLHSQLITSSRLVGVNPWCLLLVAGTGVVLTRGHRQAGALLLTAVACALPATLLSAMPQGALDPYLPRFHFSRLAVYCFLLLPISAAVHLEKRKPSIHRLRALAAAAFLLIPFVYYFRDRIFFFDDPRLRPADFRVIQIPPPSGLDGRLFVVNRGGAAKFNVESMLYSQGLREFHARGLHWESHRNNTMVNSYAVGLYNLPAVIDYYRISAADCGLRACLYGHFFSDYAISEVLLPEIDRKLYREPEAADCDAAYFGDAGLFRQTGSLIWNGHEYRLLEIDSEGPESSWIELIDMEDVREFSWEGHWYFGEYFETVKQRCSRGVPRSPVFIYRGQDETVARIVRKASGTWLEPNAKVQFRRIRSGEYAITIEAAHPVLFKVKLNSYPGFQLLDERGERLPLLAAYGSLVGFGHGRMTLVHVRGWRFILGYALTVLAAIGAGAVAWRSRSKPARPQEALRAANEGTEI